VDEIIDRRSDLVEVEEEEEEMFYDVRIIDNEEVDQDQVRGQNEDEDDESVVINESARFEVINDISEDVVNENHLHFNHDNRQIIKG
jgi:hypothetical protein